MPKIIDPVFAKTSPKRSFCLIENERFGLVFVKTGSINSGTGLLKSLKIPALLSSLLSLKETKNTLGTEHAIVHSV